MTATIRQIARHVGLSEPTVSHVLNQRGQFREETRRRVLQAASELGYQPNAAARAMRNRRSRQVGVLVANAPSHPYATPQNYYAILGLNDGLQAAGFVLCIVRGSDVVNATSLVFRERVLDGLVVLNSARSAVEMSVEETIPQVIWADTSRWGPARCIRPDETQAGRLAAEALVRAGAQRVVYVAPSSRSDFLGMTPHYSVVERLAGVRQVVEAAGLDLTTLEATLELTDDVATRVADTLAPGTGVVCYDAARARGVQAVAMRLRRVPGADFGLACCEDIPELGSTWPELTRAGFDRYALGQQTAELVLRLLDPARGDCDSVRLACRIEPGTTAPCGIEPRPRHVLSARPAPPGHVTSNRPQATLPAGLA